MRVIRLGILSFALFAMALPAEAQLFGFGRQRQAGPPPDLTPYEAEVWPFPPPDPKSWWEDRWPRADEEADPLRGRRVRRGERLPEVVNGVDAATYRLWGLMPLQWQLIRGDEMILEVWTRPTGSVRQTVTRVVVRGDGRAFVQGRAGLACCEAGIARRMGFDRELPAGSAERLRALRSHPVWSAPRDVRVEEAGAAEAVCVEGWAYDLTLAVRGRATTVRRACDPAEIGQAADVLEAVLGAALGHDPRFDVALPRGADFGSARRAYEQLVATGGRLRADPQARSARPNFDPQPAPPPEPEPGLDDEAPDDEDDTA